MAARDNGIAPAWFFHVEAREIGDNETLIPLSFWTGDEDITLTIPNAGGGNVSRVYRGGVNLRVNDLKYVADLTNGSTMITVSQVAALTQLLARSYNLRLAPCEIHATSWNNGSLVGVPQLQWAGIIDEGPIATPSYGNDGQIAFTIRSKVMTEMTVTNPAKSSDEHQLRRLAGDTFCRYSSIIGTRKVQWRKD